MNIIGVAAQLAADGREEVLQAPAGYDGVEAQDDGRRQDAQQSDAPPELAAHLAVGPIGVGLGVAANDKLAHHARYA